MSDVKFMRRMRKRLIDVGLDFADLERETPFHRSTFSRAYNGKTELRESTRIEIEDTVARMVKAIAKAKGQ